jgi:hypothetical protein
MKAAALAAALAIPAIAVPSAQEPVTAVIARAAAYVDGYQRDFAMVVSEERYQQEARYPSPAGSRGADLIERTVLRSDFLLVRDDVAGWVPFRDVFERDGVTVRDREERLSRLFLDDSASAVEQARRIADESARYNVGNLNRNINLPTLALLFLTAAHRPRFRFTDDGRDGAERIVQFVEIGRPTYVATTNGRDLPVSGRFWIDDASGRVERTELSAVDKVLTARITVTYRRDDTVGLWVPQRMEELYKQMSDRSEIRGTATYSRFRRFQIRTTEDVAH